MLNSRLASLSKVLDAPWPDRKTRRPRPLKASAASAQQHISRFRLAADARKVAPMAPGTGGMNGGASGAADVPLSTAAVARRLFPLYLTHINQVRHVRRAVVMCGVQQNWGRCIKHVLGSRSAWLRRAQHRAFVRRCSPARLGVLPTLLLRRASW